MTVSSLKINEYLTHVIKFHFTYDHMTSLIWTVYTCIISQAQKLSVAMAHGFSESIYAHTCVPTPAYTQRHKHIQTLTNTCTNTKCTKPNEELLCIYHSMSSIKRSGGEPGEWCDLISDVTWTSWYVHCDCVSLHSLKSMVLKCTEMTGTFLFSSELETIFDQQEKGIYWNTSWTKAAKAITASQKHTWANGCSAASRCLQESCRKDLYKFSLNFNGENKVIWIKSVSLLKSKTTWEHHEKTKSQWMWHCFLANSKGLKVTFTENGNLCSLS